MKQRKTDPNQKSSQHMGVSSCSVPPKCWSSCCFPLLKPPLWRFGSSVSMGGGLHSRKTPPLSIARKPLGSTSTPQRPPHRGRGGRGLAPAQQSLTSIRSRSDRRLGRLGVVSRTKTCSFQVMYPVLVRAASIPSVGVLLSFPFWCFKGRCLGSFFGDRV